MRIDGSGGCTPLLYRSCCDLNDAIALHAMLMSTWAGYVCSCGCSSLCVIFLVS